MAACARYQMHATVAAMLQLLLSILLLSILKHSIRHAMQAVYKPSAMCPATMQVRCCRMQLPVLLWFLAVRAYCTASKQ
jgi:hypothetical protein